MDQTKTKTGQELFEVDLGELKSLQQNQVHIDELNGANSVAKGQQIVDDSTVEAQKFKLVMIGRKITDKDTHLIEAGQSQHLLTTEVFHESGEKYSKGILKGEGLLKHYLRRIYLVIGMVFGVSIASIVYQGQNEILVYYEDYLDMLIFD